MVIRKYRVTERKSLRVLSPTSGLYPECFYTLEREPDAKVFRVTLSKALGWKPGDVVEVEDLYVEGVKSETMGRNQSLPAA